MPIMWFFSDPFQYNTIGATLWLALPVTIINLAFAVPVAFRVRLMHAAAAADDHSGAADHARHGVRGRWPADVSRAAAAGSTIRCWRSAFSATR
jgi:hypothetical protein